MTNIEKKAQEFGYSGLFALVPRKRCEEDLEYARKIGDSTGIMLSLMLLQNRNAYDQAVEELGNIEEEDITQDVLDEFHT